MSNGFLRGLFSSLTPQVGKITETYLSAKEKKERKERQSKLDALAEERIQLQKDQYEATEKHQEAMRLMQERGQIFGFAKEFFGEDRVTGMPKFDKAGFFSAINSLPGMSSTSLEYAKKYAKTKEEEAAKKAAEKKAADKAAKEAEFKRIPESEIRSRVKAAEFLRKIDPRLVGEQPLKFIPETQIKQEKNVADLLKRIFPSFYKD